MDETGQELLQAIKLILSPHTLTLLSVNHIIIPP